MALGAAWALIHSGIWIAVLLAAPLYLTYYTYKVYLGRIDDERRHVAEMADLHLATIEALALAIDAKDQTTQAHIRRVQVYAAGLAGALGMPEGDIQGVKTAALLHDIGKLAVPEHILSKPGPLTQEEFQKIRVHPQVGAEIISAVPFPYPVAPLILSHHERWDGKGYPRGLKGEDIPLGARILSVVDHFDAMTSDRPYHKAMTNEAAMALLNQEKGKALDPTVLETFIRMLPDLSKQVQQLEDTPRRLTVSPSPEGTVATAGTWTDSKATTVFDDIAHAHREIYALYEIAQTMGTSLGVSDTMALITSKLISLVPFSSCALFLFDEETETLRCRFATGNESDAIAAMTLKNGQGLSGWVARNLRPLVNARPSADFEAAGIVAHVTSLQSALVSPLVFNDRFIGTLAVYHVDSDFYTDDHRRLLERVSKQASAVINNSIVFEQTQEDSLTDPLTGLPNTRFMFMHLARELARAERLKTEVALLVMDLDNFKEINDTHGHHVGDRALREVAAVLRTAIRPYDMCVRYAGDEFIVVLPGCGQEEAERKRLEAQRTVDQVVFEVRPGRHVPLAISVGAAIFPQDGETYEALLATADSRMYRDKARRKRQPRVQVAATGTDGRPAAVVSVAARADRHRDPAGRHRSAVIGVGRTGPRCRGSITIPNRADPCASRDPSRPGHAAHASPDAGTRRPFVSLHCWTGGVRRPGRWRGSPPLLHRLIADATRSRRSHSSCSSRLTITPRRIRTLNASRTARQSDSKGRSVRSGYRFPSPNGTSCSSQAAPGSRRCGRCSANSWLTIQTSRTRSSTARATRRSLRFATSSRRSSPEDS